MPKAMRQHTLYRFWNSAGQLLYVGITDAPVDRWRRHGYEKSWWREVAKVTIAHFDSRRELEMAETAAIRSERPRYNVKHNRGPWTAMTPRTVIHTCGSDERKSTGRLTLIYQSPCESRTAAAQFREPRRLPDPGCDRCNGTGLYLGYTMVRACVCVGGAEWRH